MKTDQYSAALRRIATAMQEWEGVGGSDDCQRLQNRLERHRKQNPQASFIESSIEARMGFMAAVLAESEGGPSFTCPECKGHHFGSRMDEAGKVAFRVCNDEFSRGCRWRGTTPDEGMNHGKPE